MKDILLWILAILGAIGGFLYLINFIKSNYNLFINRIKSRAEKRDFIYRNINMSARIITDEKEGISYRECSIESKVNNLSKIHIGVGPVHILESTLESLTSGLKIEKDTTPEFDTEWDNYILKLPKALMKGDKYHFKIKETAKAKRGKKMARCLSFVTDRQLDQLTLSVSFSKTAPNEVYYREYLVSNELRMEETLYPSEITFEAKKTSKYCRPRIRYALEW